MLSAETIWNTHCVRVPVKGLRINLSLSIECVLCTFFGNGQLNFLKSSRLRSCHCHRLQYECLKTMSQTDNASWAVPSQRFHLVGTNTGENCTENTCLETWWNTDWSGSTWVLGPLAASVIFHSSSMWRSGCWNWCARQVLYHCFSSNCYTAFSNPRPFLVFRVHCLNLHGKCSSLSQMLRDSTR